MMPVMNPPRPPHRPSRLSAHDHVREDPYAWLRDDDWDKVLRGTKPLTPDIQAHLEAENTYAEAVLAPSADLRRTLLAELKARIKEDDSTVPAIDGAFAYYQRYVTGGQHPIFCRRRLDSGAPEEVLLDGDKEAQGTKFFRIAGADHSPDHRLLAYAADRSGAELFTIRFRDVATGAKLPDELVEARGDVVWANDGQTVFYTVVDEHHRPNRVFRHRLGTDRREDALVYAERDPGFYVSVDKTESRGFVVIATHDHATAEIHVIDADVPDQAPRLIQARQADVDYEVSHIGERFVIRTNVGDAEDFKIVETPIARPGRENWRDVVAHRPGRLIRSILLFHDWLVRLEREDGLPRIVVRRLSDGAEHAITFDEAAYELGLLSGYEFATDTLRFTYSSLATPPRTFDYDLATRTRVLRKEQEIPSGHDPAAYVTRRILVPSHDGEQVPISLVHRRGLKLDGAAPLLLYGYGAYGYAMPASFSANRFSLIDRGFVYAIAHVRGGMDRGYRWYRDGKLMAKRNTIRDFIAAAEGLIAAGYTRAGSISAHGASAGGIVVGGSVNERPDLFRAIVGEVPFVDVLTTMADATLPLTPPEWTEWGNPITDAAAYRYMLAYSPYDNIRPQAYPAILATAGLTDPRVTYWEPAKWVVALRDATTSENPALLKINLDAGHGGASGRFDRLEEVALVYAFVLQMTGRPKG
ncbi:MAG: S9 family peptidase [Rhodospirillales bacterium]|nr:S9 family peptidase [Rhodospirillales bacterium]